MYLTFKKAKVGHTYIFKLHNMYSEIAVAGGPKSISVVLVPAKHRAILISQET